MEMVPRAATGLIDELASALRVVIVNGPRQSGKTTLLKQYQRSHGGTYRTLDDRQMEEAARSDPVAFTREGDPPRLIDEVHRGGDWLVRAVKTAVDEDPSPGRFLLSGSSRFLTIPTLSESLAGRAAFVDLWPLSAAERTGGRTDFYDRVFGDPASLAGDSSWTRTDYLDLALMGGYPEVVALSSGVARRAWYDGYLTTIVNRDISNFAEIDKAHAIPRLLALLAARTGSPLVLSTLARAADLSPATARQYLTYLDVVFLTTAVPAWSANLTAKIAKTPKIYLTDSGLAGHLMRATSAGLRSPGNPALGPLVETLALTELLKLKTCSGSPVNITQLRDTQGREIDFILEGPDGRVVAVEIKATTSPGADSAKHLRWFRDQLGERFSTGLVLHLGTHGTSFGDRIQALPLSVLWGHAAG
ncbi:MAG: DUF4143 domain-containing protein [Streptosporangiales bacterium]|nr:DUF4143 domain-containing protein [Streptosporangiales bacterium]